MKIITVIARFLLGFIFLVFGLNGFLHFIPSSPPSGTAGQFVGALFASPYLVPIFLLQIISAVLLLVNPYVPLARPLLAPIIVNILLIHILMLPSCLPLALVVTVLCVVLCRSVRLASAVTVLSAADRVRVFQEFATLDLLSNGRAEIVAGRGSFIEAFPLFGLELEDYDSLFAEKLDLLLNIREHTHVHWSGKHRAALTGQGIYPRPLQNPLPVWLAVGGTPVAFVLPAWLGLPLMVAIIGREPHRFRPLIDRYREVGLGAGHSPQQLKGGVHWLGYVAENAARAANDFFPGYAQSFTRIARKRG